MLKHNLLLIFKSRLTIIIFSILVVVTLGYTFLDIYFAFSKIGSIGKVFNGEYMITKPYAASSFSLFYEDFSALLFLIVPISLCFIFSKSNEYETVCKLRGNNVKKRIVEVLSVSIVITIIFLFLYLISLFSYYFTMGFEVEPWCLSYYKGEIDNLNNSIIYLKDNYFLRELFWSNNGKNNIFFFIISGLITSILYFSSVFTAGMFAQLFKNQFRLWAYIVFTFLFFYGLSLDIFSNVYLGIVELSKVVSMHTDIYIKSIFVYILICILLSTLFFGIRILIDKKPKEGGIKYEN